MKVYVLLNRDRKIMSVFYTRKAAFDFIKVFVPKSQKRKFKVEAFDIISSVEIKQFCEAVINDQVEYPDSIEKIAALLRGEE